jgi:hypothetical protein
MSSRDANKAAPKQPALTLRDEILQEQRAVLRDLRYSDHTGLDPLLREKWMSLLANLTDSGWKEALAELRREVASEQASRQRANANNLFRRWRVDEFLHLLDTSLERLESKCMRWSEGK